MISSVGSHSYPLNLYRDICSLMGREAPDDISDDQLKGLDILLKSRQNERYRIVLLERYKDNKTLEEIGKLHNFTGSRAGQMVQTALKKLASSKNSELIFGYDEYIATATIDSLELSTRAERAFLRNEINTLEDIKYKGKENIKNLRNLGDATIDEIMEKTWFLWDEDEEEPEKLSKRQIERISDYLHKKGWRSRDITLLVRYVDDTSGKLSTGYGKKI